MAWQGPRYTACSRTMALPTGEKSVQSVGRKRLERSVLFSLHGGEGILNT